MVLNLSVFVFIKALVVNKDHIIYMYFAIAFIAQGINWWMLIICTLSICIFIGNPGARKKRNERILCCIRRGIITLSISEFRIGSMLFSISILVILLFKSQTNSGLIEQLDNIRCNLSLGKIDLDTAESKIEVIP